MARQYVQVKFNPWDQRAYTYHNDAAPVAVNDRVFVETKRGTAEVVVIGVSDKAPRFDTKPLAGRALV